MHNQALNFELASQSDSKVTLVESGLFLDAHGLMTSRDNRDLQLLMLLMTGQLSPFNVLPAHTALPTWIKQCQFR